MDESVCWNVEKSLKHWKPLCLLNQMQNRGKLHSAVKLYRHVCEVISLVLYILYPETVQLVVAIDAQNMVLSVAAIHSLWIHSWFYKPVKALLLWINNAVKMSLLIWSNVITHKKAYCAKEGSSCLKEESLSLITKKEETKNIPFLSLTMPFREETH